jgi:hypothetical protein
LLLWQRDSPTVIVWLNGTFGADKTTVATEPVRLLPAARPFDAVPGDQLNRTRLDCMIKSGPG